MFFFNKWKKSLFQNNNLFLLLLFCFMAISCFYAPSFNYSSGAFFSIVTIFGLLFFSAIYIEEELIVRSIFAAVTLFSFISLIFYFAYPEVSRMKVWEGGEMSISNRISGIAGNANILGFTSAFGLLMALFFKKYWHHFYFYVFLAIHLSVLILSQSRTSMVALILSLIMGFLVNLNTAKLSILLTLITLSLGAVLLVDIDYMLRALSRSGDAVEITSGTGRIFLWNEVIYIINQRPWTGWGYASSSFIMPEFSYVIGYSPLQAHNLLLQILFFVGYIGLFLFLIFYFLEFYMAYKNGDKFKVAGLFFIFFGGIAESSVFTGVANMATLAFAAIVALNYKHKSYPHLL